MIAYNKMFKHNFTTLRRAVVKNLNINNKMKNNHGMTTLIECHDSDFEIIRSNIRIKEYFKLIYDEIGVEFSLDNVDEYPHYLHEQVLDKDIFENKINNVKYIQAYGSSYTNIASRIFYKDNKMLIDIFSIKKYYPGDMALITKNFFNPAIITYDSIPRYF
jgi:hypothetical protein